jgi:hypothetical protein
MGQLMNAELNGRTTKCRKKKEQEKVNPLKKKVGKDGLDIII